MRVVESGLEPIYMPGMWASESVCAEPKLYYRSQQTTPLSSLRYTHMSDLVSKIDGPLVDSDPGKCNTNEDMAIQHNNNGQWHTYIFKTKL